MNRIILMGNGFDLAHGLETGYCDFLNYYWKTKITDLARARFIPGGTYDEDPDFTIYGMPQLPYLLQGMEGTYNELKELMDAQQSRLVFKNKILETITTKHYLNNWVDVENESYSLLKGCMANLDPKYGIKELNADFERIKIYLQEFLTQAVSDFTPDPDMRKEISRKIFSPVLIKEFSEDIINALIEESYERDAKPSERPSQTKREYRRLIFNHGSEFFSQDLGRVLFLNFNYTSTEEYYTRDLQIEDKGVKQIYRVETLHIHGSLKYFKINPIIFGFGDELDEAYKEIEKLNDNNYLENIKSIKYLETDYYKHLIEFIYSDQYQIFIMGHSCGISDRTLLNTLFEHKNCVSIKPYFHKISNTTDNYSDIVRNISRNFNDKVAMRDKVVNKEYCKPLLGK